VRRLAELRRLAPAEWRTLLRAWLLLVVAPLLLRVVSLPRLLASRPAVFGAALPIERVAWLVGVAARYAPSAGCLPVALVTARLLARQGTPATLRIGIARDAGHLSAHAWLEREGRVLGAGGQGYAPILGVAVGA
jgi:hypothetical protein